MTTDQERSGTVAGPPGPVTLGVVPSAGWTEELRAVVRLALPVVMVQIGLLLLGVVDTMMLGRVSKNALAAGALGNAVSFGFLSMPMGLLMALDPLVAQAYGAGDRERVSRHFARGLVLALYLAVPIGVIHWFLGPQLHWLRQQPELVPLATDYLRTIIPGVPFFLLFIVLRQTLQAMGVVRPAVFAVIAANLFNVLANYALVFGNLGFPALGVAGSGIATSASRAVLLLVLALASVRWLDGAWRRHLATALPLTAHRVTLRLGLPIGIQHSFEFWLFTTVGLMMGSMGAAEFAGHQIALNLSALSFMVPLGVSGAASTRVGNAIGRLDGPGARRSATVCLLVGAGVMTLSATIFALFPRLLSRAFTPDVEVLAVASVLLPIAAVFQIADGTQAVGAGVLRGAADTRVPAIAAFVGFWAVGLPCGWYFGFRADYGPEGLWWGLTAGLAAVALLFVWRIRRQLSKPVAMLRAEQ